MSLEAAQKMYLGAKVTGKVGFLAQEIDGFLLWCRSPPPFSLGQHVLLQIEFLGRCCFPRHFISSIKASFRRPQNSNFLFVSLYQKCRKRAFGKHAKASGCSPARRNVTACQSECIKKGWSCILEQNRSPSQEKKKNRQIVFMQN